MITMWPTQHLLPIRQLLRTWLTGCAFFAVIGGIHQVAFSRHVLHDSIECSIECATSFDQDVEGAAEKVDFVRDILPILEQHCFSCHGIGRNDGDLELDSESAARRGGHTGLPLLATPVRESELYQRIIADEPSYRMPKRAAPLTEAEIQRIQWWIEQGASYDGYQAAERAMPAGDVGFPFGGDVQNPDAKHLAETNNAWFSYDRFGENWLACQMELSRPRYRSWPWLSAVWGGWILLLLLKFRYASRWVTWKRLFLMLVLAALGSLVLYQQGLISELRIIAQVQPVVARRQSAPPISFDRQNLTLPTYPMHPPRLGGVYYRGNDERDPALFNNGFYRTATLEVWLVDRHEQVVGWDEPVTDHPLSVKVLIRRAPGTTPQLFTKRIMEMTYLRRFRETELIDGVEGDESNRIELTVLQPDQLWEARIPLEPRSNWHHERMAGVIYLFYGNETIDGHQGRVHFGIRYDLRIHEGKISLQSELWMGSMYDLGGRVLIPQEGEVLLDRWFDFRPIPEIEGENPDDPELLGLPEHYR